MIVSYKGLLFSKHVSVAKINNFCSNLKSLVSVIRTWTSCNANDSTYKTECEEVRD